MQGRSTENPNPRGTIGVEAFDAAYGAGFQAEEDSPHAVECELVEDAGVFEAHRPPGADRPRRLAFVDGTMRTEARLTHTGPAGEVRTGLAGSWAAGAVLVAEHGPARFDKVTVGRTAIFTGGHLLRPATVPSSMTRLRDARPSSRADTCCACPTTPPGGAGNRTRSTAPTSRPRASTFNA